MRFSAGRKMVLMTVGVVLLSFSAWADTLEMKDGRLIQGKYVGGSEYNVRFLVNGKVELYGVKDILNLSFSGNGARAPEQVGASTARPASPASSPNTVTVPAGIHLLVRMIDGVDSATNKAGDPFRASLEEALAVGENVIAPKGADVYGRLAESRASGRIAGRPELRLELTGISLNGKVQPVVTSDYDVSGKSRGKGTAEKVGGGAAVGAIIGAIAGGGKGAAIGAGVGAGAGAGVQVLTKGNQVRVPSETVLEFTLSQPLTVQVAPSGSR